MQRIIKRKCKLESLRSSLQDLGNFNMNIFFFFWVTQPSLIYLFILYLNIIWRICFNFYFKEAILSHFQEVCDTYKYINDLDVMVVKWLAHLPHTSGVGEYKSDLHPVCMQFARSPCTLVVSSSFLPQSKDMH